MQLSPEELLDMYRYMVLTREFERRASELFRQGIAVERGHSSIGQEAVAVGACVGLRADDLVLPSLRTRGAFLVKGLPLGEMLAVMCGRAGGPGRGSLTSHHLGDLQRGILAGTAVVGSSIPLAVGAALAAKINGKDYVTLVFFGDGASNRGDFHEGLNLAAILSLPVIFICENNGYAMSTPASQTMGIDNVADRVAAYGFPGVVVDGNDVIAVSHVVREAVSRARAGSGPTLVECKTYRWSTHSERPQRDLRSKEELDSWKRRCPIQSLRRVLLDSRIASNEQLANIDGGVLQDIQEAVEQAQASPVPHPEQALEGVYARFYTADEPLELLASVGRG